MSISALRRFGIACLAAGIICTTGCDSSTGPGSESEVTFEGRVTDEAGFGKSAAAADVEGAVVTASNVTASGSLDEISGEATTDAEGRFRLDVDGAAEELVLVAEKTGFRSKTIVYNRGGSTVRTMPMTVETHVEADVYVEARAESEEDDVSPADIAVYVTKEVAADVQAGSRTAAEIAAAIRAEAAARKDYVRDDTGDDEVDDAFAREKNAFLELQADLAVAASADAEADAIESFENALIEAYADADVSFETQAKARQAGRTAITHFGNATFEMQQKAEILAAMATASAVEASFEAEGASSARLNALSEARADLIAELRAASSSGEIADAKSEYESSVRSELASEAEVEENVLVNIASSAAIVAAKTTLELALSTAASAGAVASAHAAFYASAETSAETSLSAATSKASFAAKVLALLSIS